MELRPVVLLLFFVSFIPPARAQESPPQHLVQDWSSGHVIFTGLTPENLAEAVRAEPRAWHSWLDHAEYNFVAPVAKKREPAPPTNVNKGHRHKKKLERDWQMPILIGVAASPAKFSFDVNALPDCVNDYVVFPTANSNTPGANGNASLIAFNNLYTGPGPSGICPSPSNPNSQPSVLFAYNTATTTLGEAHASPVLSLDGKKIAFVESNDGFMNNYAAFHVLTWKAGEGSGVASAVVPGDCSPGNSCMTTLVVSNRSDSESDLFVDYANDIAYVGDDGEQLHKISPVFSGTPAEIVGNGWPVQLETVANGHVHSPVYDSVTGRVFVTNNLGSLFIIDAGTGALLANIALGAVTISDPVVDSTNQTVFVFMSDSSGFLAVAEFDTSGILLRKVTEGQIGGDATVRTGTFDHNYFNDPSSGMLYFTGSVNFIPSLYGVGFAGKTMNATASGPLTLTTGSPPHHAGALTEIYNPNLPGNPDRLFVAIGSGCANGSSDGCIESFDITNGFPSGILDKYITLFSGPGDRIVVDNVSSSSQASSIYFEIGQPGYAVKLTQAALQ